MRILLLCHRLPFPPRFGGQLRPFHMAAHLHATHEVTLASLMRKAEDEGAADGLRDHCSKLLLAPVSAAASRWRALARLPTRHPSSMGYFHSPRLAAAVRQELARERYDLILVHCSSMAPYVASIRGVPKMLDFADMDSQKWLAYATHAGFPLGLGYEIEGRKLQRAEAELASRFDMCTCTTRSELDALRGYAAAPRAGWFPNGVDTDYFCPAPEPYDANVICFVGRMDYFPNQECVLRFCDETLPRLRRRRPALEFHIIGAAPGRAVRRLARRAGVVVTGTVADVRPHVRRAALSVAPLRIARGTQNKILESLAMGVPVVCSPLAACGVDAVPGEHLLTAADGAESAAVILSLLDDAGERRRLAEAGRARMLSHHGWGRAMRQLDRLVEECRAAYSERSEAARVAR